MTRGIPVVLLLVAGLFSSAFDAARAAEGPTAESQAKAKAVLGTWHAALTAAKSLSADLADEMSIRQDGKEVQSDSVGYRFAFERPNRLAVTLMKGNGVTVVADGKQLYEYVPARKAYQQKDSPAELSAILASQVLEFANFGQGLGIVGEALQTASVDELVKGFDSIAFVGEEDLGGAKTQRLRIEQSKMPVDLWFTADGTRLVRFAPDMKTGLKNAGQQVPDNVDVVMTISFNNWAYDVASADAFKFTPPADAEQVADIFAPPPHKLLGAQAPAFETTTIDGKPLKSTDLAGKVVVLDFWATWCGPCVRALPDISATAAKYKDKGVEFFAVNQGEEASIIKEFFAAQKLSPPTALDLEGKVGTAFGVEGIPQTVVIDKNGKIQVVHVGAGPDIGKQLAKELEEVLAGKDLVGEKKK